MQTIPPPTEEKVYAFILQEIHQTNFDPPINNKKTLSNLAQEVRKSQVRQAALHRLQVLLPPQIKDFNPISPFNNHSLEEPQACLADRFKWSGTYGAIKFTGSAIRAINDVAEESIEKFCSLNPTTKKICRSVGEAIHAASKAVEEKFPESIEVVNTTLKEIELKAYRGGLTKQQSARRTIQTI